MNNTFVSYVLHAVAGVLIVASPYILGGTPATITSMTLGGVLAMVFKWAHDYLGY